MRARAAVLICAWAGLLGAGELPGLHAPVRVVWDSNAIPHIFAGSDADAMAVLGYLHARHRFFQMDLLRRQASGTSAELLGPAALAADIRARTLGLRRAAEASWRAHTEAVRALLEAYARGVNAWLRDAGNALPVEYVMLELTRASIPEWSPVDSLTIAKALAFQLSFDAELDMALTVGLAAAQRAGERRGFDGSLLFFEDVMRAAPFDPTVSITRSGGYPEGAARREVAREAWRPPRVDALLRSETVELARRFLDRARAAPLFEGTLGPRGASNWWVLSGRLTATGFPMLASDPHMTLSSPPIWYEAHLMVSADPVRGPMNVAGVTLPGVPGVILGCNERLCWGATMTLLVLTDVYEERLVMDPATLRPRATLFEGREEPLAVIEQRYRVNRTGNAVRDDLAEAPVGAFEGGLTFIVPRRNYGPIVAVEPRGLTTLIGLSVQYAGWGPTREPQTFLEFARAGNVVEFGQALRWFTFGSQNWACADADGNIAYFTSGEIPLREDLETLGRADGAPPYMIRDGTHRYRHEWLPVRSMQAGQALPYEILPREEMPHVYNPPEGFVVNANNDPVGLTLGNDPLARRRATGGVYYLSPGYDGGFRARRIAGLIRDMVRRGERMTLGVMAGIQANHQMLDAEVFVPHIVAAWERAQREDAGETLRALARDREVAEAVARLRVWDFSTPTGIREGFDPGDDPEQLAEPGHEEVQASIAATLYSVWRGQFIRLTVDAALERAGLGELQPPDDQTLAALRRLLENYPAMRGRGSSGLNFFEAAGARTPEEARDLLILRAMRAGLDLLAGEAFVSAFLRSRNQDDYRWGKLHRVVFRHPLAGIFNQPPEPPGLPSPLLPGFARSGGFQVVDASSHSARAASVHGFMFGSGPSRRFVAEVSPCGVLALESVPGPQGLLPVGPGDAARLKRWLVNAYHRLAISPAEAEQDRVSEERFQPAGGAWAASWRDGAVVQRVSRTIAQELSKSAN
ncbi:MAG: penicillin acylase family protein [Bryobacterales bacterium]|nr:penicillin acylase family protein [Bryobacterales bacterium]